MDSPEQAHLLVETDSYANQESKTLSQFQLIPQKEVNFVLQEAIANRLKLGHSNATLDSINLIKGHHNAYIVPGESCVTLKIYRHPNLVPQVIIAQLELLMLITQRLSVPQVLIVHSKTYNLHHNAFNVLLERYVPQVV